MDKWKTRRWSQSNGMPRWPYIQLALLILVFSAFILWGFGERPSSAVGPSTPLSAPMVYVSANVKDVTIYDISSVLEYPASQYSMTGIVRVPRGKSASVYIDIFGPEKVALAGAGWTALQGPNGVDRLVRRFSQHVSPLSLEIDFDTCNCVSYTPPYLVATTANVQTAGGPPPPGGLATPGLFGGSSTVTLGFRQSELDIQDSSIPDDLNILAASPQAPTNTAAPDDLSWPGAADGSVTAISVGASASREMHLFAAGLLFGIAGSAFIGSIQAGFTIRDVKARHVRRFEWLNRSEQRRLRRYLHRLQADADKHQAVYDRVLRDGRGKSVAQVRGLLAQEWHATFGIDIPESELLEKAKILAAGDRIEFIVHMNK